MKHLKAINKYFWKYRYRLSVGLLFVLLSNYFNVLSPQVTGFIIDFVQKSLNLPGYQPKDRPADYDPLVQLFIQKMEISQWSIGTVVIICGIVILLLALVRGIFLFFMRQTIIVMSRHIEYDQKIDIYQHYQRLDSAFFKQHSTGDLMNRIAEDVSRVRQYTGPAIMYFANLVGAIVLAVYFMYKRDPLLTFYVLIPLPILALTIYFVNNTIHRKSEKIQAALSDLTTNAQESYSGIRVIKSFIQEKTMLGFFRKNAEEYRANAVSLARTEAIYFPAMTLLIGISTLTTVMIGGIYAINGTNNIGVDTIVEFVMYVNMLTFPVSAIGLTASMTQRAAASQKRINEFLDIESSIKEYPDAKDAILNGDIEFNNVNFTYPDTGIQAIKDFSLQIKKGEKVAVVGKTGSGKTTLVQLLLRMYDVDSGQVKLDSTPVTALKKSVLREQIAYVSQDVFLFSDNITNNILFGAPGKTQEEVELAATRAHVHEEILRFPEGYNTIVGERGVMLSGGQKQRITIARALVKTPAIAVFDDCLSAVDAKTENIILTNLSEYLQDKTAIIITHRIFSLLQFDKIIVLDEGRVVETGTHEELIKEADGYYAKLYRRQQEKEGGR